MRTSLVRATCMLLMASLANLSLYQSAHAAMIGTAEAVQAAERGGQLARIEAALAREEVRAVLEQHGVTPADAMARVARLTDEELALLAGQFDELPAGGIGIFEVLGITFLVLLVLELTGVINIFQKI